MSQPLPELVISNPSGSCWTCVDEGRETACDRSLPWCTQCQSTKRRCSGYHVRLKWDRPQHAPFQQAPHVHVAISTLGLAPDEDRLLQHFSVNVARISTAVDHNENGYRRLVAVACNDQALLHALLALSASHLSRWQKGPDDMSKIHMRQSLQHLRTRLREPALAKSETTLMTMLMLLVFELCGNGSQWKHHWNGVLSWIKSRRDCDELDPFLPSLVGIMATQVLLHNPGEFRQQSYQYLSTISDLQSGSSAVVDPYFGFSLDLPCLIIEATRLDDDKRRARSLSDETLLNDVYSRAIVLEQRIRSSVTSTLPQLGMLACENGGSSIGLQPYLVDAIEGTEIMEAAVAAAEIFRCALRVYVCRIIHDPMTVGRYTADIGAIIDKTFQLLPLVPDTVGPGSFLGWALVVIGAEIDANDRRQHIRRRLQSLELLALNHGIVGLRILDEVWSRRDALTAGTSNNRRCGWQEVMEDFQVDIALV